MGILDAPASIYARRKITTALLYEAAAEVGSGTGKTLSVIGIDTVAGAVLASDRTGGNYSLSLDGGATWAHGRGMPANSLSTPVPKLVRFGAYVYSMTVDATDALVGIHRSLPATASTTYSWSSRLVTASASTSSTNGKGTTFAAGSSALMLGDYGDYTAGPSIQRSLDGVTWTTVWGPDATTRHVHCIAPDPYNAGHWYATLGDNSAAACLIRSTNNGDTWSTVVAASNSNQWQSVQISFDANNIYLASDRYGNSAVYVDRATLTPRMLPSNYHAGVPVPGGRAGRIVTDLVTTSGSATVTSATAAFTSGLSGFVPTDKGRRLLTTNVPARSSGTGGSGPVPISTVNSATSVTMAANSTATSSGQTALIVGDEFYRLAYMGAVDPATGVYYLVAQDTSVAGNTFGIFACLAPGTPLVLLDYGPTGWSGGNEVFIYGGFMWSGGRKVPLIGVSTAA